jgi:hypothetical protein
MADYTDMPIEDLQDVDVTTGKSKASRLKRFKKAMELIMGKKLESSVPETKRRLIENTEAVYEKMGKLSPKPTKTLKVMKKGTAEKSLEQLSREGNADEIVKRLKKSK